MKLIKLNFILIIIFMFIASLGFSVAKKVKTSAATEKQSTETSGDSSGSSESKYIFAGAIGYNWHWGSDYKDTYEYDAAGNLATTVHDNAYNFGKGWECDLSIGMFLKSYMALMLDVGMSWNSLTFENKWDGGTTREEKLSGSILKVSPKLRMYSPDLFEKFKMFVSAGLLWGIPGDAELENGHWRAGTYYKDTETYDLNNALGFRGEIGGLYSFSPTVGAFLLFGADLISYNIASMEHSTSDPNPTNAEANRVVTFKDSTPANPDDSIAGKEVHDASTFTIKVGIQVLF